MIIHITHQLPKVTLELEFVSKDKETHSYLQDRPELLRAIQDAVRTKIDAYSITHDNK